MYRCVALSMADSRVSVSVSVLVLTFVVVALVAFDVPAQRLNYFAPGLRAIRDRYFST
jgi:hypothetical protein